MEVNTIKLSVFKPVFDPRFTVIKLGDHEVLVEVQAAAMACLWGVSCANLRDNVPRPGILKDLTSSEFCG